jgi:hypothetical protein
MTRLPGDPVRRGHYAFHFHDRARVYPQQSNVFLRLEADLAGQADDISLTHQERDRRSIHPSVCDARRRGIIAADQKGFVIASHKRSESSNQSQISLIETQFFLATITQIALQVVVFRNERWSPHNVSNAPSTLITRCEFAQLPMRHMHRYLITHTKYMPKSNRKYTSQLPQKRS